MSKQSEHLRTHDDAQRGGSGAPRQRGGYNGSMRWMTNEEMGWSRPYYYDLQKPWIPEPPLIGPSWLVPPKPCVPQPAPVVIEIPAVQAELLFTQALPRQIASLIWRDLKYTPIQIPSGGHTTLQQLSTVFGGVFIQFVLDAPV